MTGVCGIPGTPEDELEQCLVTSERELNVTAEQTPALTVAQVRDYVRQIFAEVLKFRAAELDDHATFETYGIDSLVGQNIVYRMEQDLGTLPATLLFEQLTIDQLAHHLRTDRAEQLTALLRPAAPQVEAAPPDPPAPVAPAAQAVQTPLPVPVAEPARPRPAAHGEAADIAVIAVSGRYPGAPDVEAFWRNLRGRPRLPSPRSPQTAGTGGAPSTPKRGRSDRSYQPVGRLHRRRRRVRPAVLQHPPREADRHRSAGAPVPGDAAWDLLERRRLPRRAAHRTSGDRACSSASCTARTGCIGAERAGRAAQLCRRSTRTGRSPTGSRTCFDFHGPEPRRRHGVLVVADGDPPGLREPAPRRVPRWRSRAASTWSCIPANT